MQINQWKKTIYYVTRTDVTLLPTTLKPYRLIIVPRAVDRLRRLSVTGCFTMCDTTGSNDDYGTMLSSETRRRLVSYTFTDVSEKCAVS